MLYKYGEMEGKIREGCERQVCHIVTLHSHPSSSITVIEKSLSVDSYATHTGPYHKQTLTNTAVKKKRSELFTQETQRQAALVTDVEKIEVRYEGHPEDCTLIMNKDMSTPYNCSQRKC